MIIALYAAIAMVAQDILGTLLTQAQARDKAALSGFLDTAGWLVGIMTISWSVTALQGHDDAKKAAVLVSVSAANFIGSWLGVMIGKKLIKAPVLASPARPRRARSSRPPCDHPDSPDHERDERDHGEHGFPVHPPSSVAS